MSQQNSQDGFGIFLFAAIGVMVIVSFIGPLLEKPINILGMHCIYYLGYVMQYIDFMIIPYVSDRYWIALNFVAEQGMNPSFRGELGQEMIRISGYILLHFLTPAYIYIAYILFKRDLHFHYKRFLSLDDLISIFQKQYPKESFLQGIDPTKLPLDKGRTARAKTPLEFALENKLILDEDGKVVKKINVSDSLKDNSHKIEFSGGVYEKNIEDIEDPYGSTVEIDFLDKDQDMIDEGRYVKSLKQRFLFDKDRAEEVFREQIGPRWNGFRDFLKHGSDAEIGLMAVFLIKIVRKKTEVATSDKPGLDLQILDGLGRSFKKKGNNYIFDPEVILLARQAIMRHANNKYIKQISHRHAFRHCLLSKLLDYARKKNGAMPPSEFRWLKFCNRPLWYVLHQVEMKVAWSEAAAVCSHLRAMDVVGRQKLTEPVVCSAVNALIQYLGSNSADPGQGWLKPGL